MARAPILAREQAPPELRDAFDAETASSGGVASEAPVSATINSPEMRRRANCLVNCLPAESSLPRKTQELAMILTARHMDCPYIWHSHAVRARGISAEFVDSRRDGHPLPPLPAAERVAVNYATELFRSHRVGEGAFQAAPKQSGGLGLTELTTLPGCYSLLALNANAFEIDAPDSAETKLPVQGVPLNHSSFRLAPESRRPGL